MTCFMTRLLQFPRRSLRSLLGATLLATSLGSPFLALSRATAQSAPYCHLPTEAITQKNALLQSALQGNQDALNRYKALVGQHGELMRRCRQQSQFQDQAIWLRLYPCDARPGALDALLDQLVNRGYNQVYVEVFYDGQVLLPAANNPTAWRSVIRTPGYEGRDLLAEAIAKGRERGMRVYAWMFTLNFGYSYAQRSDTQQVLARNGQGHTSLSFRASQGASASGTHEEVFVDPYHPQAKRDYTTLVNAVVQRQPDGVLFDYIRYPRGTGAASVASQVGDLWIYGPASQQALQQRALNGSGQDLIRRFLSQGYVTAQDIEAAVGQYPNDGEPLWQGRMPALPLESATPQEVQPYVQSELWQLSVAHAVQGVLDFLMMAVQPVQQRGISAGAVFFPEGNQVVGQSGYDSRLQAWDRFPPNLEWHPMSYGTCGNTSCIVSQVQRVVSMASAGTQVKPVIAGTWGRAVNNRPALEAQMQAIHTTFPQIQGISHFAYSWQEPQADRDRKFCQLQ
jgi:hypothetical protein